MLARFRGKERKIVAGVSLPVNDNFVKAVISLAQRTQMSLTFIHAIEPMTAIGPTYPGEYLSISMTKLADSQRAHEAKKQLERSLEGFREDYNFNIRVLLGHPAEAIRSESMSQTASLAVTGVKHSSKRFVPRGFSTAVDLMAQSSIPVLAIPEGGATDFTGKRLTMLIADDLSQTSADVVPTVAELAGTLKNVELVHFHSHPETRGHLQRWAEQLDEIMEANEFDYDFSMDHSSAVKEIEKRIGQKLNDRLEVPMSFLEKNDVSYQQKIVFGDVADELSAHINGINPDLLAFGRHHFVHKQPFSIGKIPFYAMLEFGKPVLLVSNVSRIS